MSPAHPPDDPKQPDPERAADDARVDVRVDLAGCSDKATLLARLAAALHFPDWFGHNWDALSDCLTDLSWLPARRYRIVLEQPEALGTAAPGTLATLMEILGESADFWAAEGVVFEFVLSPTPPADPSAPGSPPSGR